MAEMGRIMVPGQVGQRNFRDPISIEKSWVWWCAPVIIEMIVSIKKEDCGPGQPG
jgi:hypothetical protein